MRHSRVFGLLALWRGLQWGEAPCSQAGWGRGSEAPSQTAEVQPRMMWTTGELIKNMESAPQRFYVGSLGGRPGLDVFNQRLQVMLLRQVRALLKAVIPQVLAPRITRERDRNGGSQPLPWMRRNSLQGVTCSFQFKSHGLEQRSPPRWQAQSCPLSFPRHSWGIYYSY